MRATDLGVTLDGSDQTETFDWPSPIFQLVKLLEFGEGSITIKGEVTIPAHARGIYSRGTNFKIDANETRSGFLWRNAHGMIRGGRFIAEGEFQHHEAIIIASTPIRSIFRVFVLWVQVKILESKRARLFSSEAGKEQLLR